MKQLMKFNDFVNEAKLSRNDRESMIDYIINKEDEMDYSLLKSIYDELKTKNLSKGLSKADDKILKSIYDDVMDSVNEAKSIEYMDVYKVKHDTILPYNNGKKNMKLNKNDEIEIRLVDKNVDKKDSSILLYHYTDDGGKSILKDIKYDDVSDLISKKYLTLEGREVYKRQYTEQHPAKIVNANTKIRNKILEAIADGKISESDLRKILQELNANPRWASRNSHLFKVNEEGISLSKIGNSIYNKIKSGKEVKTIEEGFNELEKRYADAESGFDELLDKLEDAKRGWRGSTQVSIDRIIKQLKELKSKYTSIKLDEA